MAPKALPCAIKIKILEEYAAATRNHGTAVHHASTRAQDAMTIDQWFNKVTELALAQSQRGTAADIADDEMEDLIMKAWADLTTGEAEELIKRVLLYEKDHANLSHPDPM